MDIDIRFTTAPFLKEIFEIRFKFQREDKELYKNMANRDAEKQRKR